jgi:ABC-2 type transport system ATP-binding protein
VASALDPAMTAAPGPSRSGPAASPPRPPAIRVDGLWKRYGGLSAVRGVTFEVGPGEIFGLIGPDGAGKTSTFQILAGVMEASGGSAEVFGRPPREARSDTGYLTQAFSLYPDLTVLENLRYAGDLRHVPPDDIRARGGRYLELFDLDRFGDRLAGKLSGGMKQKLSLACALVSEPRVLLLDEPTTGVDPVSRREFWDALARLVIEGLTILVATPYLDEAERCHRLALIHQGEIRQMGTPAELRTGLGLARLEIHTDALSEAQEVLARLAGPGSEIADVQRFGDHLDLLVRRPEPARAAVQRAMDAGGLRVIDFRIDEPTLENVFVTSLRALGEEPARTPFPGRGGPAHRRGQVAIGAEGLTKRFGAFTAVRDVSLQIRFGEVYGLLGANGAGKTTTIKMLCGLLDATEGTVQLAGERGNLRSEGVRQQVGYMSQKFSLYDDLTIGENLRFFAGVYGVPAGERDEKTRWVLAFAGLEGKQDELTGRLPGGWKQRVAFGTAIMHEPSVLFLDEPTSGVDPLARRAFWRMINQLADAGTAILVTTHYLEESEQCNRLGFMAAGELVAEGTPSAIKRRQTGHLLELVVDRPQDAAEALKAERERWRVSLFGPRLHVIVDDDLEAGTRATVERLERHGIRVADVREARFSLEDVFISIVEKARQRSRATAAA